MIGIFLRSASQLWREMAYPAGIVDKAIAGHARLGQSERVVAIRTLRIGTISLNRYPSPVGRHGYPQGRPPNFFRLESNAKRDRQGFAGNRVADDFGFPSAAGMAICPTEFTRAQRQDKPCTSNRSFWPSRPQAHWRVVATRRWNNRCWAQGQGPRARPFWTPALPAARLSARWPTSPIASNTHRGVDATLCPVTHTGPSVNGLFPLQSRSKPEQKNRGIEHDYRENPGRDGSHRGNRRVFRRTGNIQQILLQPGLRAVAGPRLTHSAPQRAPGHNQPNHAQISVGRPWAPGAVLRSAK